MTLLDGITVGGHKIGDQQIALNQAAAWNFLFSAIQQNTFSLQKNGEDFVLKLHAIAAKEEALNWGKFRTGPVTISGTDYLPPDAEKLSGLFRAMLQESTQIQDIYDQAIFIFLSMARHQFFYDVNKRMGRFLMNGILLQNGYPIINVPAKRQLEFNTLMLDFYNSNEQSLMNQFLRSCLDPKILSLFQN
jgi:Fic family protein